MQCGPQELGSVVLSRPGPTLDNRAGVPLAALRPSEYTAALIQALRARRTVVRDAYVLEIGSGSGVVLAALADLGAASLCGIDIEEDAVASGTLLLDELGHGERAEFHQGDMWRPVAGRRFDLIVANLPHSALVDAHVPGRRATWSEAGADGRRLLDPFLEGLGRHLAPGGRAYITHNGFVGLDRSRRMLARAGFTLEVVLTTLVNLHDEKLARMTPGVLAAEEGRTIHRHGPYAFAELHIAEIAASAAPSRQLRRSGSPRRAARDRSRPVDAPS
ncbi:Methyltransferase domain-containing protein [Rhodospirillales bacterium URHD0017]|nr:Methyltransferase domain-containing protein [Rhodospirillales bacterium URHD0017]